MDKYDEAIDHANHLMTELPPEEFQKILYEAWNDPQNCENESEHVQMLGCLFQYLGDSHDSSIGCPTLIHTNESYYAAHPELTLLCRTDSRLDLVGDPIQTNRIPIESLPIFAEIQRKADEILKR